MAAAAAPEGAMRRLNVNVGVLGHIDSGKTALARALSTVGSTAAFDRAPQSRARGITLDLGFSCLCTDLPPHLGPGPGQLQLTLVDCPGHASLIRTIIGGAQIIDLMMLVIDVTKGMQTQSAECLVIGQIACQKMIVVLNKTDLLPEGKRQAAIEKMIKKMHKTLENTKFRGCPIVAVAAKPGGPEAPETVTPVGVSELIEVLKSEAYLPKRDPSGSFLMAIDHCFSIKGQGTVMTGTILSGCVSIGDNVEIPALKVTKKVKSMQMFHTPVTYAMQGDRVGICVTQFDPKLLERGLICTPESLQTIHAAIISVSKIPYFRGTLQTKAKFHITVGHETVMGRVMFFSPSPDDFSNEPVENYFDFGKEYLHQEEYLSKDSKPLEENKENDQRERPLPKQQWALLEFEKPVTCSKLCLVIGSKLDTDIHANTCRLAFHGILLEGMEDKNYMEMCLPKLKVYKLKHKDGQVERLCDDYSVIGRSLFKKETNIQMFVGLKVKLSTGEEGVIEGGFGQSGKFKIHISEYNRLSKILQKELTQPYSNRNFENKRSQSWFDLECRQKKKELHNLYVEVQRSGEPPAYATLKKKKCEYEQLIKTKKKTYTDKTWQELIVAAKIKNPAFFWNKINSLLKGPSNYSVLHITADAWEEHFGRLYQDNALTMQLAL